MYCRALQHTLRRTALVKSPFNSSNALPARSLRYVSTKFDVDERLESMESQQLKGHKLIRYNEQAWTEAELKEMYTSVAKPPKPIVATVTKANLLGRSGKVNKHYLRDLKVQYLETRKSEEVKRTSLQLTKALKSIEMAALVAESTKDDTTSLLAQSPPISVTHINEALQMSAMLRQPATSVQLFEYMKTLKITPDLRSYNFLIDAHANAGDLDKVAEVYKAVEKAGLTPNEVTMGGLIKAYVNNKRIDDAFKTYQIMESRGLKANQMIITTLIKGCVQVGQLKRAWTTFDRMRFEACRPDEVSYSLMIHACAKGNQVERAMNLFEEMVKAGLYPTDVTFNALISACAPIHYYNEAFQLLIQMADYGFMADIYTYNALVSAAAHRDMLKRAESEPELTPDEATYTNMFLAYAATARNGWVAEATRRLQEKNKKVEETTATTSTTDTTSTKEATPMLSVVPGDEGPLLPFIPTTRTHILVESRRLFTYVLLLQQQQQQQTTDASKETRRPIPKLSTQLVNGYLAIQTSHRVFNEANRVYDQVYDEHQLTRDGWTYLHMLQLHTERAGWIKRAWQVWDTMQQWWKCEDENPAISAVNKAVRRHELGCEPKQRHQAYTLMINGLAR
ncbi:hypothetical protein BDF22DRAFT_696082 [Syncephalis plumigaleata]|nr:hypothetical protein BDF22DRAFT_696082 [Syncephalis plumigaleata]